ncbi:hypothetical protein N9805_04965 [Paracoccaceae bacterium]|nr:hypothetical protein [Paracoccaceae bacterium]
MKTFSSDKTAVVELDKFLSETEIKMETGNTEEKFNAAFQTIVGVSNFLGAQYPNLKRGALTLIIEELSDIKRGAQPKLFAVSKSLKGGRPKSTRKGLTDALIVASIELLMETGLTLSQAAKEASRVLKIRSPDQLKRLRKKFNANQDIGLDKNLMIKAKNKGKKTESLKVFAEKLLNKVSQNLK